MCIHLISIREILYTNSSTKINRFLHITITYKSMLCSLIQVNFSAVAINCLTTDADGTVADAECDAGVTKCKGYVSNMHTTCTQHAN